MAIEIGAGLSWGRMKADDLEKRANASLKQWLARAQECLDAGRPADAKKMVTAAQKELRLLKAEVTAEEREMRADFTETRNKVNSSGQIIGAFMGSKARGHMARARAAEKRSLTRKQQSNADVFRSAKAAIDSGIAQLDRVKLDIDRRTVAPGKAASAGPRTRTTGPAAVAAVPFVPPPSAPPAWLPDPNGRHEHRYWNGSAWTEHVANRGVQQVDPI